jgi:hypothetical protein
MLLFFKSIYRDPILRGEKTDTIRSGKRLPRAGQVVQACVGPSRIFARLQILSVTPLGELAPERRRQVEECYGAIPPGAVKIEFALLAAQPAA